MIKITKDGKTIVGNNEDSSNPNTMIWFEKGQTNKFGVMYVGFDNFFPQGGINEAGLVFDGFTQSFRAVNDTLGKKKIKSSELSKMIMQRCSTVEEVKDLISQYNIAFWASGVLRFVDKSGKYLYVDGDSLIFGQKDWFVQTNKRPYEKKECWRLDKGNELLNIKYESTIDFCKSIMDSIHQDTDWGGTLYTTIYDLEKGTVSLYYFHDFTNGYTFDLTEELNIGDHSYSMHELLPKGKKGNEFNFKYNKIQNAIKNLADSNLINDSISIFAIKDSILKSNISKYIWVSKISNFADQYKQKGELIKGIRYYRLNVELFPDLWYVFDNLGDAYYDNRETILALENYNIAINVNPDNQKVLIKIEKLKKELEK
jgi:tetratricopeptide (TPR) repeat protein